MKLIIDVPEEVYEAYKEWHKQGVSNVEQSLIALAMPYEERPQGELEDFAKFVAKEVLDDYFEENAGAFAEIACRKLVKLGIVELKDNVYRMKEAQNEKDSYII